VQEGTAPTPKAPRPGSFEEYIGAPPERQAAIRQARKEYLLRGEKAPVQPKTATRTAKAAAQARETAPAAPAPASPSGTSAAPPAGLTLTPDEQAAFDQMVQQGHDPADILAGIQEYRSTAPAPIPSTTGTQAPMPEGSFPRGIQTAAELKEFDRLLSAGKSRAEALRLIQGMRAMQTGHGLPTSEQASQAVLDRNVKGRWPE
jgi:hypothetical protein